MAHPFYVTLGAITFLVPIAALRSQILLGEVVVFALVMGRLWIGLRTTRLGCWDEIA